MTNQWRPYKIFFDHREYVAARDKLIPLAEEYANKTAGLRPAPVGGAQSYAGRTEIQEWSDLWSLVFHQKMNEMARMAGLTAC